MGEEVEGKKSKTLIELAVWLNMHADAPRTAVQNAGALLSSVSLPVSGRSVKGRGRLQPRFNDGSGDGFHVPAYVSKVAPLMSKLIYFQWVTMRRKDSSHMWNMFLWLCRKLFSIKETRLPGLHKMICHQKMHLNISLKLSFFFFF